MTTFTAPTSPTTGLQSYNLDPRIKQLDPATTDLDRRTKTVPGKGSSLARLRVRLAAARRRPAPTGHMEKAFMSATIAQMVDTLKASVSEIIDAGVPNRAELLEKSYDEFAVALNGELEKAVAAASEPLAGVSDVGEEPLFKGLGVVGRVASLVSYIASQVKNIQDGVDYQGQTAKDDADKPSDEVTMYLGHALSFAELAMRAAVNEHVDIAEPGDDDDDASFMVLKSFDGSEDFRVKTLLPAELAKFAIDPSHLDAANLNIASAILTEFGVEQDALSKLFEPANENALRKAAPGATVTADPNADATPANGGDTTDAGDGSDQDPMGMLNLLGRLLAAAMIQLQSFMDAVGGGDAGDDTGADPNADPNADAGASATPPATPPAAAADATPPANDDDKKKPPFGKAAPTGDLAKVADPELTRLQGQVTRLTEQMTKLAAHPEAAKAMLDISGEGTLAKGAPAGALTAEQIAERMEKLSPDDRAAAMYKITRGADPEVALRKHA
jgi:hypothetical protein